MTKSTFLFYALPVPCKIHKKQKIMNPSHCHSAFFINQKIVLHFALFFVLYMFFAFLSSKYFLEKIVLVLCVRKIDLLLTPLCLYWECRTTPCLLQRWMPSHPSCKDKAWPPGTIGTFHCSRHPCSGV